eukprot:352884-Chlamydomonas_euryale.AAC.1
MSFYPPCPGSYAHGVIPGDRKKIPSGEKVPSGENNTSHAHTAQLHPANAQTPPPPPPPPQPRRPRQHDARQACQPASPAGRSEGLATMPIPAAGWGRHTCARRARPPAPPTQRRDPAACRSPPTQVVPPPWPRTVRRPPRSSSAAPPVASPRVASGGRARTCRRGQVWHASVACKCGMQALLGGGGHVRRLRVLQAVACNACMHLQAHQFVTLGASICNTRRINLQHSAHRFATLGASICNTWRIGLQHSAH